MSVHPSLEAGVRALQSGHYQEAIALLESAQAENPQDSNLHYWLARAYQRAIYESENARVHNVAPIPQSQPLDQTLATGTLSSPIEPKASSQAPGDQWMVAEVPLIGKQDLGLPQVDPVTSFATARPSTFSQLQNQPQIYPQTEPQIYPQTQPQTQPQSHPVLSRKVIVAILGLSIVPPY